MATTVCADGNQFETDSSGKLQLKVGCGLEFDPAGTGIRIVDAIEWPFACDMTTHGGRIYCDPTTGELRTAPPDRFGVIDQEVIETIDQNCAPGNTRSVQVTIQIDLTSHCEDVVLLLNREALFDIQVLFDATVWQVVSNLTVDGGVPSSVRFYRENDDGARVITDRRTVGSQRVALTAGSIHTITHQVQVQNTDTTNSIRVLTMAAGLSGSYHTSRP